MNNKFQILEDYIKFNTNHSYFDEQAEESLLEIKKMLVEVAEDMIIHRVGRVNIDADEWVDKIKGIGLKEEVENFEKEYK